MPPETDEFDIWSDPQDPEPRDLRPLVALAFIPWVLIAVGLKLADKI